MAKINKHIQIVRSSTASLSSMGQKSCDMISSILKQHYERVGITTINNSYDLKILVNKQPDLAFLGVKKIPVGFGFGKKSLRQVWLSAYLDEEGLGYTGSPAAAIALDFNKPAAKQVVKAAGLNTAAYFIAKPGQYHNADDLPLSFPLFIKPPSIGGGIGIGEDSVVRDFTAFEQQVQFIASTFQSEALVEEYLPGREFSVAILETIGSEELIAMPIELITEQNNQGDRILGQKIKNADTERVVAVQDGHIKDVVVELATSVFRVLGARDYGRIDIRLDERGIPHFLEANLIPGLAQHDFTSYFTSACWTSQAMNYETMILSIVELGLSRKVVIKDSTDEADPANSIYLTALEAAFE